MTDNARKVAGDLAMMEAINNGEDVKRQRYRTAPERRTPDARLAPTPLLRQGQGAVKDQNCYGMRWLYLIGKSYLFTVTTRGV